jgi:hypothetical protein
VWTWAATLLLGVTGCSASSGGDGTVNEPPPGPAGTTPTDPGLRVAFIGDQGLGPDAVGVLALIENEGADFVIHSGGFDNADDPDAWEDQINTVLGEGFPYFASVGNEDTGEWDGYRAKLEQRLATTDGAECTGDELGVTSACTYRGLFFLLSGVGTRGSIDHTGFLEEALAADDSIWRVCSWHVNRADFQVGSRGDEAPLGAYEACSEGRALIVNAHEQSYSRTLTLSDLDNPSAGYGTIGSPGEMLVTEESTFVTVSGLAGHSLGAYDGAEHDDDTWWAAIYAGGHYMHDGQVETFMDFDFGALFIDFNIDTDPRRARGYFKTIGGEVVDEFFITTDRRLPDQ